MPLKLKNQSCCSKITPRSYFRLQEVSPPPTEKADWPIHEETFSKGQKRCPKRLPIAAKSASFVSLFHRRGLILVNNSHKLFQSAGITAFQFCSKIKSIITVRDHVQNLKRNGVKFYTETRNDPVSKKRITTMHIGIICVIVLELLVNERKVDLMPYFRGVSGYRKNGLVFKKARKKTKTH